MAISIAAVYSLTFEAVLFSEPPLASHSLRLAVAGPADVRGGAHRRGHFRGQYQRSRASRVSVPMEISPLRAGRMPPATYT